MKLKGAQNGCAKCKRVFATLTDFDNHQDVDYHRKPVIICLDPATIGLELADGAWGTPAGNANRTRKAAHMRVVPRRDRRG